MRPDLSEARLSLHINLIKIKVGLNLMPNRLSILNGKIPFYWLNALLSSFKQNCKRLFLCD